MTAPAAPWALSLISSVSEWMVTRESGCRTRSVTVSASRSVSTVTETRAPVAADPRGQEMFDLGFQLGLAFGGLACGALHGAFGSRGEDHAAATVDHSYLFWVEIGDGQCGEVTDCGGLFRGQLATRHGDRDRRGWASISARERPPCGYCDVHAGRAHAWRRQDGPRKLTLLGTPIGGIEHIRGGAEAGQFVQQLVTGLALARQPFACERETDPITGILCNIDGIAANLRLDPHLFERSDNLTRGGGVQAGVEQCLARAGRNLRQRHDRQECQPDGTEQNDAAAQIETLPGIDQLTHSEPALTQRDTGTSFCSASDNAANRLNIQFRGIGLLDAWFADVSVRSPRMSDETSAGAEEEAPKKKSKALLFGLIGAVLLGGASFYGVFSGLIPLPFGDDETAEHADAGYGESDHEEHADGGEKAEMEPVAFVDIGEMVISLGPDAKAKHLKLRMSIEVKPEDEPKVTAVTPRIIDVLNTFLRAVDTKELEMPRAMMRLRAQMLRRVQLVTTGRHGQKPADPGIRPELRKRHVDNR